MRAQNSGPIRAARPQGRETVGSEADPLIYDLWIMIDDLKAGARAVTTHAKQSQKAVAGSGIRV